MEARSPDVSNVKLSVTEHDDQSKQSQENWNCLGDDFRITSNVPGKPMETWILFLSSPGLWQSLVQCTSLPRGVQANLNLLGDDHLENVLESSAHAWFVSGYVFMRQSHDEFGMN